MIIFSLILLRNVKWLKVVNNVEEMDMGYVKIKLNEFDILIVRVEIVKLFLFIYKLIICFKIFKFLIFIG